MFGIGGTEFIVIALVFLIFVGPKNLPPLLRKIGQITAELKNAGRELRNQLDIEADLAHPKQAVQKIAAEVLAQAELPYKEAEQADRQLRQEIAALKKELSEHAPAGQPVDPDSTESGTTE